MVEKAQEPPYAKDIKRLEELIKRAEESKESTPKRQRQIVVVGSTYFPEFDGKNNEQTDNVRGSQVLKTIEQLNKEGIDIGIVDGGSSETFVKKVREINHRRFQKEPVSRKPANLYDFIDTLEVTEEAREKNEKIPGIIWFVDQKQEGYSKARVEAINNVTDVVARSTEHEAIIQMELEKTPLVGEFEKIAQPIVEGEADIVIPDRGIRVKELGDDRDNFCNYPKFQAVSERKANLLIHQMLVETGLRQNNEPVLDLFGGTRAFKDEENLRRLFGETFKIPEDSQFWGEIKPEAYSNAVYFPIYLALALDKKVVSAPVDFSYPEAQAELEQEDESYQTKRREQFDDIVGGSRLLISFLGEKLKKIRLAGKVVKPKTILRWLRKNAVVDLEEMDWSNESQFKEESYYEKANVLSIAEKAASGEKIVNQLDEALSSYLSNFNVMHSFLNQEEFEQVRKRINLLKKGIKIFGKEEEAEEIYEKHRWPILSNLYNSTMAFYIHPNSDSSRNLDIASFFAKAVEVPKTDYIMAVLFGTPNNVALKELNNLAEEFNITQKEKREVLAKIIDQLIMKNPEKGRGELIDKITEIYEISPDELRNIKRKLNK